MAPFLYFINREQSTTIQDIGVYGYDSVSVTGIGQPEHVQGLDVTDGALPLLGVKPVLGRLFTRRDDAPDVAKTVILTYGYWQRRFGGSSSVIGRSMTIDGKSHEIIGVLPKDFQFHGHPRGGTVSAHGMGPQQNQAGQFQLDRVRAFEARGQHQPGQRGSGSPDAHCHPQFSRAGWLQPQLCLNRPTFKPTLTC